MYRRSGDATEPLLAGPFNYGYPELSADGRWLAYASAESGRFEVYVQSFMPRLPPRVQRDTG